jgi:AcrR family transcriptional regulator
MNVHSLKYIIFAFQMKANSNIQATRGNVKDKRQAILDAALSLITSYGFHGTSMKMIAETAHIAAGTIYVYFANKEEMIKELYQEIGCEINEIITNHHNPELPFSQNFMALWTEVFKCYIADPRKPEFISQYTYSPYINEKEDGSNSLLLSPIHAIFEDAKKIKLVKDMPVPALIALSHSPITALVRMTGYNQLQLKEADVKQYALACWDAIRIRKSDHGRTKPSLNN